MGAERLLSALLIALGLTAIVIGTSIFLLGAADTGHVTKALYIYLIGAELFPHRAVWSDTGKRNEILRSFLDCVRIHPYHNLAKFNPLARPRSSIGGCFLRRWRRPSARISGGRAATSGVHTLDGRRIDSTARVHLPVGDRQAPKTEAACKDIRPAPNSGFPSHSGRLPKVPSCLPWVSLATE
jgi:hypothetical protein